MSQSSADAAIRVHGLSKQFDAVLAVDAINFEVARGSITALLGGNGAGKTTTIAMILGLVEPSAGSIEIMGERIPEAYHRVLPRMNFESPYVDLPHRLTVAQNLNVFAMLYGLQNRAARIAELAADLELTDFLHRPTGQLSAGQKTRVSLAKSLINAPELLLLDEPTASLDPDTADWVRGYLENYCASRGATILLASHNMAEVERMCDFVLMMRSGRIVDTGAPDALITRYGRSTLEEVFLDIARGTGKGAELTSIV
ncbi:MAG TPA: ABC transporter ATP-binding protein [Alphaproteobacteria bacterium]|nr:ABC transporter ATP-binding protein [Alphaproteobacteria bacterium]